MHPELDEERGLSWRWRLAGDFSHPDGKNAGETPAPQSYPRRAHWNVIDFEILNLC
jgi:hypothetical protein